MIKSEDQLNIEIGNLDPEENLSAEDRKWITINEGFQLSELKFPTFDNNLIDDQLRNDITYDALMNDFKSAHDSIVLYKDIFTNLLINNHNNIIDSFRRFNLNFINFHLNSFLIQREIELMSYVIKYKFEQSYEYLEIIKKEFKGKTTDDLFKMWVSEETLKKIIYSEVETFTEVKEVFAKALDNEEYIMKFHSDSLPTPSICGVGVLLKYLNMILERSISDIETLTSNVITEETMLNFFQDCCKLQLMCSMMKNTFRVSETDIFNLKETSEEWVKLKKNYERIIVNSSYTIRKKLKSFFALLNVGNAAVSSGYKYNSNYLKVLGTGYFMAYYFFNTRHAQLEVKRFSINPKFEIAHRIWNLLDTNGIKQLYSNSLPGVKYRKKLYVKKNETEINKKYLSEMIENIKLRKFESLHESTINSHYINDVEINFNTNIGESFKISVKGEEINNYVKIKLLHNREIYIDKLKSFSFFDCCSSKVNFTRDALIIHIHGGGWVAMSSSSHESYLRKWTNETDCPIISIDYRLAPEFPYPCALDDVWQAYNWIIKNASEEFNINLNKIILVGDSAGGNLALGLVLLLIVHNKRLPDKLILPYPALRTSIDYYFNPGYLLTLQDNILPYHFLKFCLDSYLQDYERKDDPFLEPILMDDSVLRRLPPVFIIGGSSDPLRDEIVQFVYRLTKLDKQCKFYEFKYFPHGFLNYDNPHMLPEAKIGNDFIIREIEATLSTLDEDE